jgi:hypothetical protein
MILRVPIPEPYMLYQKVMVQRGEVFVIVRYSTAAAFEARLTLGRNANFPGE